MNDPEDILPHRSLRVMQIIAGALLLGVVIFLSIALVIVSKRTNGPSIAPAADLPIISVVAAVLLAVQAPLAFIVPSLQTRTALRQIASGTWQLPPGANAAAFGTDNTKLLAVRQNTLLVSLALLEGVAFLGCIAYLLEAHLLVLGVALVAVLLMLVNFPTEARVRGWLERQTDQLVVLRQQGDVAAEH
jgi:hypothetical protein